jgi:Holliday junction resolvase RusA-like endonuclease
MDTLTIIVPGAARGKGRPRFAVQGKFARAYTDAKTVSAENWIKACAVEQVGTPCLEGPLAVCMAVAVGIPESWSKKKKADALAGVIRPTSKPDCDNIFKMTDALNGIVWRDDAQIVDASVTKRYAEKPETRITVRPL